MKQVLLHFHVSKIMNTSTSRTEWWWILLTPLPKMISFGKFHKNVVLVKYFANKQTVSSAFSVWWRVIMILWSQSVKDIKMWLIFNHVSHVYTFFVFNSDILFAIFFLFHSHTAARRNVLSYKKVESLFHFHIIRKHKRLD